jgi:16S rRNA (cytosine967-C5)-methyltransferase
MTPSARLQAVIDIIEGLDATAQPADRYLRDWFRARRYAGSKDRAAVAERTYTVLRHRESFAWRMGSGDARSLVIASLLAEGLAADAIAGLFDGQGYGAAPLSEAERHAAESPPQGEPPLHVQGEFPSHLVPELTRAFGSELLDELLAMQKRAPIDLRVNTLKATREDVCEALRAEGFIVEPTAYSPWGLRLPPGEGLAKLSALTLYKDGAFEFQDQAAQMSTLLCRVAPGMRVLDLAAGAGGKSLALAAQMQNRGEIVAYDIRPKALAELVRRAKRAGVTIIRPSLEPPEGTFDVVFVDAPCSGSGTWWRQPEQAKRLTIAQLDRMTALQDELLNKGAKATAVMGKLVYATCSVMPMENEDRIKHFFMRHNEFREWPVSDLWPKSLGEVPRGMDRYFRPTPRKLQTDGFFTAVLLRQP